MNQHITERHDRRLITDFIPPEGVPIHFRVSGLAARFGAQLADILLTVFCVSLIIVLLYYGDLATKPTLEALAGLLFFALRVPYYVATEILWNGQTIGKRLLGIKVISLDGRTLSPHAVTVRNLMKEMEVFVPGTYLLLVERLDPAKAAAVGLWIILLLAVPLFSKRRQRLGDIIANTIVVEIPRAILLPDLSQTKVQNFEFLPHHLDHYGRFELQTLERLLQVDHESLVGSARAQNAKNIARVANAIVRKTGYSQVVRPEQHREFLKSFYTTQRAFLENRRLLGDSRDNKFHRETK